MIVRDLQARSRPVARRTAFTLLEVLVVVAILVILAGVATFSYFRYLDDAKVDSAKQTIDVLEAAARNYTLKNGGNPPNSLNDLVAPPDGSRPFVEGGQSAILDPWLKPYQYNNSNTNSHGDADPIVYTTNPATNQPIYSSKRSK